MTRLARIMAMTYGLAILLASLGPHCGGMFAAEAAPVAVSGHAAHGGGHDAHHTPAPKPERDCAAMEMAKAAGPLPALSGLAAPVAVAMPAILPAVPAITNHAVTASPQPRGPPRGSGFASIFARNHRLLI